MRRALVFLVLAVAMPLGAAHPEPADCPGTTMDAGDNYNEATFVPTPIHCDGRLNTSWDSTDFFAVNCPMGATLHAHLVSVNRTLNLRLYPPYEVSPPGPAIDVEWVDNSATGTADASYSCVVGGDWRVEVFYGGDESGIFDVFYSLDMSVA
ncbi:MAG: hypothetical protein ACYDCK_15525 [Thermoplasmatota archaeon]